MPSAPSNFTSLDLRTLRKALNGGEISPVEIVDDIMRRIGAAGDDRVWIHRVPDDRLREQAAELERAGPDGRPLYGIPFAIKDNIDLAGHPTTAGCPEFAYTPDASATVVGRLEDAGAICIGKTNLDQFATGLVGVRSPYGISRNPFDARYIPGGSSSGSAVAVASGLVSFALGTDTAGSGRVPAAFNNIVGLKPTRGLVSAAGVVPACRSLDCVAIFALTAGDAGDVLDVVRGHDPADCYSRHDDGLSPRAIPGDPAGLRVGVPGAAQLEFFGNDQARRLFAGAVSALTVTGATMVELDLAPFQEAARLLYEGPWVAERYVAIRDFIEATPEALHPVTRKIIAGGATATAAEAFAAHYRLEALRRETEAVWDEIDVLLTPTAGTIYTVAEVEADPIRLNSNLGIYSNFMNLLDLSGIAVPAGFQDNGLPFGVTLVAPAFQDRPLARLAAWLHAAAGVAMGATGHALPLQDDGPHPNPDCIALAVCGAHMSGLPLNHELVAHGGRLVRACRSAPHYRLFALEQFSPPRPGIIRAASGSAIEVEVWNVPKARFGDFLDGIPAPLSIGTVTLEDGIKVKGFLCEAHAIKDALDITDLGSWRRFVAGR